MKVLKFGGKSIATTDRLKFVADIVIERGKSIVIVPAIPTITAMLEDISEYLYKKNIEGATETISKLEEELNSTVKGLYTTNEIEKKALVYISETIEYIASFTKNLFTLFEEKIVLAQGEIICSRIFHLLLKEKEANCTELSALDFMLLDKNSEPVTDFIKDKLTNLVASNNADIYVTQGYICRNLYGEISDFRKGGNDYTATLVGSAINAEEIQIWTDVEELKNIDSAIVDKAKTISNLSFDEAAELAYFGDKVLHPTSILPAKLANIPVRILSIINPDSAGTLISNSSEKGTIKAVAAKDDIISIRIKSGKMLLAHGFLRKIFEVFEKYETSIDMLASSEIGVSITIDNSRNLEGIINDLKGYGTVSVNTNMSIICIIGDLEYDNNAKSKILEAMKGLPVKIISYGGSNHNLSFLIEQEDKKQTLLRLNDNLFLN